MVWYDHDGYGNIFVFSGKISGVYIQTSVDLIWDKYKHHLLPQTVYISAGNVDRNYRET